LFHCVINLGNKSDLDLDESGESDVGLEVAMIFTLVNATCGSHGQRLQNRVGCYADAMT